MSTAKRTYRLIDADTHVNEPGDLWLERLPAKFKDRAPRIQRFDDGDAWVLEGVADPINFGLNATAGMSPLQMQPWCRWEDIRPGGYDASARRTGCCRSLVSPALLLFPPRWLFHFKADGRKVSIGGAAFLGHGVCL